MTPSEPDPPQPPGDVDPHHVLNNPVGEPDPTEWPDPYEKRPDPRGPVDEDLPLGDVPHPPAGTISTSEPHPDDDIENPYPKPPQRDHLDE